MSKRIIYTSTEGFVVVMTPVVNCGLTVEQIAEKDVPTGLQYFIIDESEIPTDRTFRNAWTLGE